MARRGLIDIGFFLELPNGQFDYEVTNFDSLYTPTQGKAVSLDQLRRFLADLPCCASSAKGDGKGDPLNFVLIGSQSEVFVALVQQNWNPTLALATSSLNRTVKSFLSE
jgi:hypothetical protein